jgi:hypothetical protein
MSVTSREVAMQHFDWNSNFSRLVTAYSNTGRGEVPR